MSRTPKSGMGLAGAREPADKQRGGGPAPPRKRRQMTGKDIIRKHLGENGYDGLFCAEAGCACEKEDLFPCGSAPDTCEPGYKKDCACEDQEHGWHIEARK